MQHFLDVNMKDNTEYYTATVYKSLNVHAQKNKIIAKYHLMYFILVMSVMIWNTNGEYYESCNMYKQNN